MSENVLHEFKRLKRLGWEIPSFTSDGLFTPRIIDESEISFPSKSWEEADSIEEASSFWANERATMIERMLRKEKVNFLWEVGAGNGTAAIPLRNRGIEIIPIEPLKSGAITLAKNGFQTFYSTLEDLRLPDNSIDAIGAFDVLEHLDNPRFLLDEVYRVLKPGGIFVCSVPSHQWLFSDFDVAIGHYRRYSPKSLKKLVVGSKLNILDVQTLFGFLILPAFLLRRIPYLFGRKHRLKKVNQSKLAFNWFLNRLNSLLKLLVRFEALLKLKCGLSLFLVSKK
jgi:SAM-dependent methyltransferase